MINNVYWKMAINRFAQAETYTSDLYSIHARQDWDFVISERFAKFPKEIGELLAFSEILFKYDILITSYKGFAIDNRLYWRIQAWFFKLCQIKIVVIPFGSDAYDYTHITSTNLLHGLMQNYRTLSRSAKKIRSRLNYWNFHSDFVIPGFMGLDGGLGRWDVLICSPLIIDTEFWKNTIENECSAAKVIAKKITVGHFPNHEEFKGTKYIRAAIQILQEEGLDVELLVLSGLSKDEIKIAMCERVDILFEQINFVGYAMTALEAMSCSLPVIANLEDSRYTETLYYYSYLSECPVVSANHDNLVSKLRTVVLSDELRHELGAQGRKYVDRYHSINSGEVLFKKMFDYLFYDSDFNYKQYEPDARSLLIKQRR